MQITREGEWGEFVLFAPDTSARSQEQRNNNQENAIMPIDKL